MDETVKRDYAEMIEEERSQKPIVWYGEVTDCNICDSLLDKVFYDGRLKSGSAWLIMCPICHAIWGRGIGLGIGQEYTKQGKDWVKTNG